MILDDDYPSPKNKAITEKTKDNRHPESLHDLRTTIKDAAPFLISSLHSTNKAFYADYRERLESTFTGSVTADTYAAINKTMLAAVKSGSETKLATMEYNLALSLIPLHDKQFNKLLKRTQQSDINIDIAKALANRKGPLSESQWKTLFDTGNEDVTNKLMKRGGNLSLGQVNLILNSSLDEFAKAEFFQETKKPVKLTDEGIQTIIDYQKSNQHTEITPASIAYYANLNSSQWQTLFELDDGKYRINLSGNSAPLSDENFSKLLNPNLDGIDQIIHNLIHYSQPMNMDRLSQIESFLNDNPNIATTEDVSGDTVQGGLIKQMSQVEISEIEDQLSL